jgi:hypothetical protein
VSERRAVELTEAKWAHLGMAAGRALVLLARYENGEQPDDLQKTVIRAVRRDLRELVETLAGALG